MIYLYQHKGKEKEETTMKEKLLQLNYSLTKQEAHDLLEVLEFELFSVVQEYLDGKKSLLEVRAKLYQYNAIEYYRYLNEYIIYCVLEKIDQYKDEILSQFDEEKITNISDKYMTVSDTETILLYIKENKESKQLLTTEFSFTEIEFTIIQELIK